ncbi:MAG: phosphate ABC transporter permease subunit PstC [Deltaproteobacteria bacterium]|nr:phosphate ABC transporter permease subunit PstC [Deltaproteobacteria bacterium]
MTAVTASSSKKQSLMMSRRAGRMQRLGQILGQSFLFSITSLSAFAVLFIFFFITRDAIPFFMPEAGAFNWENLRQFFSETAWYPSARPGQFGALSLFYGSAMVTLGAILVAVPLGISAAVCLSDVLAFNLRQIVKPVIEILAAIPSVAYGFFALVVFAPLLQNAGGTVLAFGFWIVALPILGIACIIAGQTFAARFPENRRTVAALTATAILGVLSLVLLWLIGGKLSGMSISSGTNAFNVSIILGIMALPTVVSVSEDALQAVGRELREGSYALGATRAETIIKTVMPAAISGILAAVILGVMRAVGETMVVWMASGNAAQIPSPFYNFMEPVRTLTATIAGDMGEADHVTGSERYHVLFALALCLLAFSFIMNLVSEAIVRRSRKKLGKE